MKMAKKQFRIGELAKRLEVEQFVVRFWEKEFNFTSSRQTGKQRFYDEQDYAKFKKIKQLLYEEKFTISGAKEQLKQGTKCIPSVHAPTVEKSILQHDTSAVVNEQINTLTNQMIQLREKLIKLHKLLQ